MLIWVALPQNPAFAEPPRLRFPVVCNLGVDCWLMNVPDVAPEKGKAQDFACGAQTYDGHSGTDIATVDRAAMEAGVDVIAAAAGTVQRLRDGEDDLFRAPADTEKLSKSGRACGNGLIIDHGDNWTTQYCHLRKGSFKVKQGDTVKASQTLAQIGLSGLTQHPSLQLTVRYKGDEIDPFTGREPKAGCGMGGTPLWGERVLLDSYNLYDAGFAPETPDFALISQGLKPPVPDRTAKKLVFWFAYFAARKGDRIDVTLTSPQGQILAEQQITQESAQARQYYFAGRVQRGPALTGTYIGTAKVTRVTTNGDTRTEHITRELILK